MIESRKVRYSCSNSLQEWWGKWNIFAENLKINLPMEKTVCVAHDLPLLRYFAAGNTRGPFWRERNNRLGHSPPAEDRRYHKKKKSISPSLGRANLIEGHPSKENSTFLVWFFHLIYILCVEWAEDVKKLLMEELVRQTSRRSINNNQRVVSKWGRKWI